MNKIYLGKKILHQFLPPLWGKVRMGGLPPTLVLPRKGGGEEGTQIPRTRGGEKGFHTAELMMSVAIFSLIALTFFRYVTTSNQTFWDNEIRIQIREQAERAIDRIFSQVRAADRGSTRVLRNVTPTASLSSINYYIPADAVTDRDAIGIRLPERDPNTGTVLTGQSALNLGNRVVIFVNSQNELVWTQVTPTSSEIAGTRQILARNVSLMQVTADQDTSPNWLEIRLNLSGTSVSQRVLLEGEDPTTGSAVRGSGARVGLRNNPNSQPPVVRRRFAPGSPLGGV